MLDPIVRYLQRIKRETEIYSLLQSGVRWKCSLFKLVFRENSEKFDKFAVLVSKRHGSAVQRNRIKRVFREIFYNTKVNESPFYDILICPHHSSSLPAKSAKEKYRTWRKKLKAY